MHLTVYRVAKDSGIPQSSLAAIVAGQRAISAGTALRLVCTLELMRSSGSTFRHVLI